MVRVDVLHFIELLEVLQFRTQRKMQVAWDVPHRGKPDSEFMVNVCTLKSQVDGVVIVARA